MDKACTIAIIDDDAAVRDATKALLRSFGYSIAGYSSAEEFLESGCVSETRCVITDMKMAGISGIELQARLNCRADRIPVIFMTAFATEDARNRALQSGAYGFLTKPFRPENLIACLELALQA